MKKKSTSQKSKKLIVILNAFEWQLLNEVVKMVGYRRSEAVRQAIRDIHRKLLPFYEKKGGSRPVPVPEKHLTPEQKCASLNGEIITEGDVTYCKTSDGAIETFKPLNWL